MRGRRRSTVGVPRRRLVPVLLAVSGSAGCSGSSPSVYTPAGPTSDRVAGLWWLLFWISMVVLAVVAFLLLWVVLLRRRATVRTGTGERAVVIAGVVLPALVLASVYVVGLRTMRADRDPPRPARLAVDVIGHQWWWEVRYPGGAVTANEIHVPAGRPVRLRLTTVDVNHSFWVPQLTVKTDLVAGRVNRTWLEADRPGRYRGQCAEYCGVQHGNMAFVVVAQPPAAFRAWLADQRRPARQPTTASQARGRQIVETGSCASCHTVRGTSADGRVGPDLTHVASRQRLAGETFTNTPGNLGGWISNPQSMKPGNKMPPQPLSAADLQDVIRYLESLK